MKYLFPILFLAACVAPVDEEPTAELDQEIDQSNGTSLNGTSLNGTSLNGTSLNGTSLNGTSLNGTSTVGSTWTGTASNGVGVNLRIDAAAQGTGTNSDLWFYKVSYQTSTGWSPLCGVDASKVPIQAVAVAGMWAGAANAYAATTAQFTWACRLKTVAKCVELGYKTWKGYTNQMTSCVRMLRGDYCGTGVSYTRDGQLLNVYDSVGVQADTEAWQLEAGWTPNGAMCVADAAYTRFSILGLATPPCFPKLLVKACTFAGGALLLDELSPTITK